MDEGNGDEFPVWGAWDGGVGFFVVGEEGSVLSLLMPDGVTFLEACEEAELRTPRVG